MVIGKHWQAWVSVGKKQQYRGICEFLVLFRFLRPSTFASSTGEKDVVFRETEIINHLLIFKKQLLCQNLKTP